ncbi:glycosyltransferase family 4 protein [Streptomyces sp. NPDC020965]|uniref:glycosyltransferase family 4 protein n=1 Tax=Streptomyces sp. NPDC020965 TaxID=3365105 RepID=UPI00378B4AA4
MKISFLIHTVYGIGGTIRTTLNLAEELADRHEIEIVSVLRHRDEPLFAVDPRITLVSLVDTRPSSPTNEIEDPRQLRPAEWIPRRESRYREYSALTDERVRDHYADSDADVIIATRPALIAYIAQFAPEHAVLVGQEHMTHNHHKPELRAEMLPHFTRLDALVTVSEGDAASYREHMPLPDTRVLAIPNSVPEPVVEPSDTSGTTVMAAGRLSGEKQYDVLIEAFAQVVAVRPEWTLRICGWGAQKDRLRLRVDQLGLHNNVHLMGPRSPIEPEWVKGAIAVSTSRHESFGMTLVEAMRCGLPVVSTDCDHGPREIIADGVDGLLVPVGDARAVAGALLRLIDDEGLRRRMGAAAVRNGRRFDPGPIAKLHEELFTELGAAKGQVGGGRGAVAPRPAGGGVPDGAGLSGARADVVVTDDGGVVVSLLPGTGPSGGTAPSGGVGPSGGARPSGGVGPSGGARLVCVHPHPDIANRYFTVDGEGRARIPGGADLPEGVWTCHLTASVRDTGSDPAAPGSAGYTSAAPAADPIQVEAPTPVAGPIPVGDLGPLAVRAIDQRGAMRAAARVTAGEPVRQLVPYPKQGALTLRSWVRPVHAEVGAVRLTGRQLTLEGRLLGTGVSDGAPVLLLRRRGAAPAELEFPGTPVGRDGFRVTLPCAAPVAERAGAHDVWDLWLRYAPGTPPARLARVLDDVVEKGSVFPYPVVEPLGTGGRRPLALLRSAVRGLGGRSQPEPTLTVFYSATNDLVLKVVDKPTG